MNAQELDDVYTQLCHALTAAGEEKTALVLARLSLLLMQQAASAAAVAQAIDDATDGMLA
ncbi:MAG: hypothetical protein ABI156_00430 [Caldimonas sp.]